MPQAVSHSWWWKKRGGWYLIRSPPGNNTWPLFLLHINDLPDMVHPETRCRLFADDCLLYHVFDSINDQLLLHQDLTLVDQNSFTNFAWSLFIVITTSLVYCLEMAETMRPSQSCSIALCCSSCGSSHSVVVFEHFTAQEWRTFHTFLYIISMHHLPLG